MRGEREVRIRHKGGVLVDNRYLTPVDEWQERARTKIALGVLGALLLVASLVWLRFFPDIPRDYPDIVQQFKYGSIGSEPGGSVANTVGGVLPPYWVFRVLPEMFPDRLPGGYESLGFIFEEGRDLPIGVSRRRRFGVDQVGLNCAICHTGTYRESASSEKVVVPGMPAHQLDLQGFFRFVLMASTDERLTPQALIERIEMAGGTLGPVDRLLYRRSVVPRLKITSQRLLARIGPLFDSDITPWGRGRVDTFNPYKAVQFNWNLDDLPLSELQGASDFPSLWAQKPRQGMQLHWDGNNDSVAERNLSASLGAGVTPVTADHERIERIADWAWNLEPPSYPFTIDADKAARGRALYQREQCGTCHADHRFPDGKDSAPYLGQVTPIREIGTDPHRLDSYTALFCVNQGALYPHSPYRFTRFRKTDGYANQPLDGLWARAPYLHNGSVPTLRDLLRPPEERPSSFFRGYDVYDSANVGFVSDGAGARAEGSLYDTSLPGNSNEGHLYGVHLTEKEKDDLVEYLKMF